MFIFSSPNSGGTDDEARVGWKQFNGEMMTESRVKLRGVRGDPLLLGAKGSMQLDTEWLCRVHLGTSQQAQALG